MGMALLVAAFTLLAGGHSTSSAVPEIQEAAQQPTPPTSRSATEAVQQTAEITSYSVQAGDTLFAIAAKYNTRIDDIVKLNPSIHPEQLSIGQRLQVPVNTVKHPKTRAELADVGEQMVLSVTGEPSRYLRKIEDCTLTAYTNSFESTGKHPGDPGYGITASGQVAKEGLTIAVDPELVPLHSVVYIPGIGVRYAEDTGGAVKGRHIDVFFNDDDYARQFGVKRAVDIYILEEGVRES
jgi:3D (Asp-Asp-Asp) domain-containing protein